MDSGSQVSLCLAVLSFFDSMVGSGIFAELSEEATLRFKLVCTIFLDALFLAGWLVANYYVEKYRLAHPTEGLDLIIYRCAQCFFGCATLSPIAIFIYRDFTLAVIQANARIAISRITAEREIERARDHAGQRPAPAMPPSPLLKEAPPTGMIDRGSDGAEQVAK
jgi:hypothetical protein